MRDAFGSPQSALVLGGGSDIARAILVQLAPRGLRRAVLATPHPQALQDRLAREPLLIDDVCVEEWDARDAHSHEAYIAGVAARHGEIDLVVCAVGTLGHQSGFDTPAGAVDDSIRVNFSGPAAALLAAARHLVAQGHGSMLVLSSVAGVRVRKSNFVYGSAKAGLDAFAQGLTDALAGTPVTLHVIRPGFVRSKMTTGLPEAPFTAEADAVAAAAVAALGSPQSGTRWVPAKLRPIFFGLNHLPRPLWRRISADR